MKVALITGASAGLGKEFLKALPAAFPDIEEYWLISRNRDKLLEAARLVPKQCRVFPLDLTKDESYDKLSRYLGEFQPEIALLINNSGCGFLGDVGEGELSRQVQMVDLNLKGLTAVTHLAIPYMPAGGHIVNISSIASFCPNARMTVYSASKSYVTAFTLGIGEELKKRGITATAVCPGPMDTDFIVAGSKAIPRPSTCFPTATPPRWRRARLRRRSGDSPSTRRPSSTNSTASWRSWPRPSS